MGMEPIQAAAHKGTKQAAWHRAQATTQRRCDPSRCTAIGETSCKMAPASSGIVPISPEATCPIPNANTKAGR